MAPLGKTVLRASKTVARSTPIGAVTLMAVDAAKHPKRKRKDIIHKNAYLNPVQATGMIVENVGIAKDPVKNTIIGKLTSDVVDVTNPSILATKAIQETAATGFKGTAKVVTNTVREDAGFTLQGAKCVVGATSLGVTRSIEMALRLPAGSAKWILVLTVAGIVTYYTKKTFNTSNVVNLGFFAGTAYTIQAMLPDVNECKTLVANPRKNKNLLFKDTNQNLVHARNAFIIAFIITLGAWGVSKVPTVERQIARMTTVSGTAY